MKRFIVVLLVLISGCKPATHSTADLSSPSQETRDAAAKILRATAKPPSKLKWLFFTSHIRKGESETNILALVRSYHLNTKPNFGMGGLVDNWVYRLDDYWCLSCDFNDTDKSLMRWKLLPRWRAVAVWPSTNFTGIWINYYANGQRFTEGTYTNGIRSGKFTTFEPDGLKSSVWDYNHGKANGLYTQYFPSGQIQYQVQYSNSVSIGIGVWYNKDDSTNHITDYSKPRTNAVTSVK